MRGKRILITGAAGFIGSNMTDLLSVENEVVGIDNFSNVDDRFIRPLIEDKKVRFEKADIRNAEDLKRLGRFDLVIHLAANSDVRGGSSNPELDFDVNANGTLQVLEFMRLTDTREIAFASSSTVYGEASVMPTPENYGPYMPISSYGASKMAGEGFITAYSHYYSFRSIDSFTACIIAPSLPKVFFQPSELSFCIDSSATFTSPFHPLPPSPPVKA